LGLNLILRENPSHCRIVLALNPFFKELHALDTLPMHCERMLPVPKSMQETAEGYQEADENLKK